MIKRHNPQNTFLMEHNPYKQMLKHIFHENQLFAKQNPS